MDKELFQNPRAIVTVHPRISICIPVFNGEDYIQETIESVLKQSYKDFELIVFDNGSRDSTPDIIASFSDPRIRSMRSIETISPGMNWNRVVGEARGHWIKLLCADDTLTPDSLRICIEAADKHKTAIAIAGCRSVIGENSRELLSSNRITTQVKVLDHSDILRRVLITGTNPIGETLSVIWRSDAGMNVGGFSNYWQYYIDIDFWLKISKFGDFVFVPELVGSFRVSRSAWTSRIGVKAIREATRFYGSHESFSGSSRFIKMVGLTMASAKILLRSIFISLRSK
jgi:glycosyltransferase involved in cell wall biosynthesis